LVTEYVEWVHTLFGSVKRKEGTEPTMIVEQRFNLKSVSEKAFGTNDVGISVDFGPLHIVDLKFGRRFVSPKSNRQLMYYAIGIIEELGLNPTEVHLWIYGPRMGLDVAPQHWACPMEDLKAFHEELKAGAKRVDNEPTTFKTGDHCLYCNKAECPKVKEEQEGFFDDIEPIENNIVNVTKGTNTIELVHTVKFDQMTTEDLLKRLSYKDLFTGAFSDIGAVLKSRAEGGEKIPDHKLVQGYGNRAWKPTVTDLQVMQLGLPQKELYEAPKRKSAPQLEKSLKTKFPARTAEGKKAQKKVLTQFNTLVEKPERGVKLVHVNQPGDPVLPMSEEFDDVDQPDTDTDFLDLK
jgi:hypothetical protein